MNDRAMKNLNQMFFHRRGSTDVIAFTLEKSRKRLVADVAISADMAQRNARTSRTTPLYELYLYVVHGILHVLGWNDRTTEDAMIMQQKSLQVLASLGIQAKRND